MNTIRSRKPWSWAAAALLAAVAACDSSDNGVEPLGVPTAVTATATSPTRVRVTWTAAAGATSYAVLRGTNTGASAPIGTSATTTFNDSLLLSNTTYNYSVRAIRGTDTSAVSQPTQVTTPDRPIRPVTADITTNTTWSADTVYQLTRIISVANAATLTIQAGGRVIGGTISAGQAPPVTAIMVLRGARLVAEGTADRPIVFTSAQAVGDRFPGDWGGLIMVGNAVSNRTGRVVVEGPAPADTVGWNGGTADADNSGSLRYVRVEFAGAASQLNVELNSFSFYAVGSGTRLEYLQALRGLDDHFEWFGGTVDGRYLVSYEAGDDHFDAAEGYRGRNQFLIGLQTGPRVTPRPGNPGALSAEQSGFEVDGCGTATGTCATGFNSTPFSMPVFANFTVVGPGPSVLPVRPNGDGGLGANIRRGTGGSWVNGVIARWPEAAISVFDPETDTRITTDSLTLRNILFADNARNYDAVGASNRFAQETKFASANITIAPATTAGHALFTSVPAAATTIANNTLLDWRPVTGSAALTGGSGATLPGRIAGRSTNFFGGAMTGTTFVGAADPAGAQWWSGWSVYFRN